MIVLGIYDDHNASAALSIDGEIVFAAQEERFTRIKNEEGFPRHVVSHILGAFSLGPRDIDEIAIGGQWHEYSALQTKKSRVYTVKDYVREMEEYWKPKLRGEAYDAGFFQRLVRSDPRFHHADDVYDYPDALAQLDPRAQAIEFNRVRSRCIAAFTGVEETRIRYYDHHTCHILYGYYANPRRRERTIGLTIDAYGDGRNQTVWRIDGDAFDLLAESAECELARVYRTATLYLGMKPYEHEYKVMGLAPYARAEYADEVATELSEMLAVDGMRVVHRNRPADLYQFMVERFKPYRFDNVAGGVQRWLEQTASQLLVNIHQATGLQDFVFSGGVAMNVKLNKVLADLPFVRDFYVCGSSADESVSVGACYAANRTHGIANRPLPHLYLGPRNTAADVRAYLERHGGATRYQVTPGAAVDAIAGLLAGGEVVARVDGPMEFGARALGNRSLLANPSRPGVVREINEMIKNRDFWMPFALSVMEEHAARYLRNPKGLQAAYMATAMDTLPEHLDDIRAGTHPYDDSVRPQVVSAGANPGYHALLAAFQQRTGIGALLNTSFNLHGLPLVSTVDDAFHVFERSKLRHMVIEGTLISKAS
jgi:carbamoyltransferase